MRPLIAGNWKMNGSRQESRIWLDALAENCRRQAAIGGLPADIVICPPYPYLALARDRLDSGGGASSIALGAQDCHAAGKGAHTGDVSAAMLRDIGCRFVILGHSERRQDHGEKDKAIAAKAMAAAGAGLSVILCVGETAEERQSGLAEKIVEKQIVNSIPDDLSSANLAIAYEPVWAIGTGLVAGPGEILAMHGQIREWLRRRFAGAADHIPLLYGGSVKPGNAKEILQLGHVDGALVGGASLVPADFWAIVMAAG